MTALTALLTTSQATPTLSTASAIVTTDGGNENYVRSKLAQATTGYGQLYPLGNTGVWSALGSIGSPDGNGWLFDVPTLSGQQFSAGNWSALLTSSIDSGSVVIDIYLRVFKRSSAGVYTSIVTLSALSQSMNDDKDISFGNVSAGASPAFGYTDRLYMDCWVNVATNSIGGSNQGLYIATSSTAGKGNALHGKIITPGYVATSDEVSIPVIGSGFVPGIPGVYGGVQVTANSGTVLEVYSYDRATRLREVVTDDFYYLYLKGRG